MSRVMNWTINFCISLGIKLDHQMMHIITFYGLLEGFQVLLS
jgi:hypothetical protein